MQTARHRPWVGFTLIELLVVIAVIGILVQLTLPAVENARESSRNLSCRNNLKQIALAMQMHHNAKRHLPSSGWTWEWAGDPEYGSGKEQPGSWIFNILAYIEQDDLRNMGSGLEGMERAEAIAKRCGTPVALFHCPSRRLPRAYKMRDINEYYSGDGLLPLAFRIGAKSDFAACVGGIGSRGFVEFYPLGEWTGPTSYAEGTSSEFVWPIDEGFADKFGIETIQFDGVSFGRSEVTYAQITDGLSNTYLVGEKNVTIKRYQTGSDHGDNEHMYAGFNNDVNRTAFFVPAQDLPEEEFSSSFGSSHPDVWNMAYADGSVKTVSYDIDLKVHRSLGSRNDGGLESPGN